MPNSAELIAIVADATGFAPPTVATYFRVLRVDQRVGTGGRGRNSMILTLGDATKVLVAALTSGEAREAPEAVETIYALKAKSFSERPRSRVHPQFAHVLKTTFYDSLYHRAGPRPASFAAALDAMMAAIAEERLTPMPGPDDFETTIPAGDGAKAARRPAPRSGDPYARLELRAVLTDRRFRVEGATLAFGRREIYGVTLDFADPARAKTSSAAFHAGDVVADRRWVGLAVLRRLVANYADVSARSPT